VQEAMMQILAIMNGGKKYSTVKSIVAVAPNITTGKTA